MASPAGLVRIDRRIEEEPGSVPVHLRSFVLDSLRQDFPCYFARTAMLQSAMFGNAAALKWPDSAEDLYRLVLSYIVNSEQESDNTVLILSVDTAADSLAAHEIIFWEILKYLKKRDGSLPTIDEFRGATWTYSISNTPLFVTGHSEYYRERRSRSAHEGLFLVIQPKKNLTRLFKSNADYRQITTTIRARVDRYDLITRSPRLGSAESGHFPDATQFWLPSINEDGADMSVAESVWFDG